MMRTGRNAMRSAGIDARSGAPERRFDAYPWRHPVTESSYINSLANRPYRSTVKTLPATLPEPWAVIRGQRLSVKASRLAPRGRRTGGLLGLVAMPFTDETMRYGDEIG